jgi:hypothetical protein
MYDDYRLQKLASGNYNAHRDNVLILGNLFYRNISIIKDDHINVYALNRDYEIIDSYQQSWQTRYQKKAGVVSRYLFPFTLTLQSDKTRFVDLYFRFNLQTALWVNILFFIVLASWIGYKYNVAWKQMIPHLLITLMTGIFGFIAALIFSEKS